MVRTGPCRVAARDRGPSGENRRAAVSGRSTTRFGVTLSLSAPTDKIVAVRSTDREEASPPRLQILVRIALRFSRLDRVLLPRGRSELLQEPPVIGVRIGRSSDLAGLHPGNLARLRLPVAGRRWKTGSNESVDMRAHVALSAPSGKIGGGSRRGRCRRMERQQERCHAPIWSPP